MARDDNDRPEFVGGGLSADLFLNRRHGIQAGLALLMWAHSPLTRAATLLGVRIWPAREYTRVTIESDVALQSQVLFIDHPPRLAVDISGLVLNDALRDLVGQVRPDDPFISAVRAGQYAPTVVRLVFDLRQPVRPQWLNLPPVEAVYQHRLVLDLMPTQPIDPLEALIRDLRSSPTETTPSPLAQDPIAEIWQRHRDRPVAPPSTAPAPEMGGAPAERFAVIAIDAGHGGEDPGAIGPAGTREKDVVLSLAKKLRDRINQTQVRQRNGAFQLRAFLIRDGDYFVPLHVRVQKAHQVRAELFLSIHADAFFQPQARGASVFALSQGAASSAAARWMAQRENRADAIGGLSQIRVDDAQVRQALFDMSTSLQINHSLLLGQELLAQMRQVGRLHKPQVEQAGFAVLRSPEIPSVLVESAFISNPLEEALLNTSEYQDALVSALHQGVLGFFRHHPLRT
ncbi:MAG: N-acetylmuramoyl-L-alanine amidase [Alphaproteobacteria bacterium]|nr:N-acetylmuramoyl-L-alanine amidase [Alphaproteobacteria bacterium]